MKLLTIVAMFALVAVQLSCAAPVPDDEKKEAEAVPAVAAVEASSHAVPVPEAKSEQSEAVASLAEPAASSPHAEEKKA